MALIDKLAADYLASADPDPTQKSIDAVLSGVTRVRVVPFANFVKGTLEKKTLLDVSDSGSLASFRDCFAIVEDPESFGHCMCCGEPHLELYRGDTLVATFGYHHGASIRWNAWKHDAWLKEPEKLLDWMSAHGVSGPRQEVEQSKSRQNQSRQNAERWLEAMPACLRPFWANLEEMTFSAHVPAFQEQLLVTLRGAIPDTCTQALTLFGWFGSGAGPWSGFPSYESVPEHLLLHYATPELVDLIMSSTLTDAQWHGAARYFGGWTFSQVKRGDLRHISALLKRRLLEIAKASGIPDNIQRATQAFDTLSVRKE